MGVSENLFEKAMENMGLEPRTQQTKLVSFLRQTVKQDTVKFIQAGTGVGKSFAILTAALEAAYMTGRPSVVVCPMNSLIDQYVVKDAPRIKDAVGGVFAYIKGRSRYLCAQSRALQELGGDTQAMAEYEILTKGGKLEWSDHGLDPTYGCPGANDCTSADAWVQNPKCQVHASKDTDQFAAKPDERPECTCTFYCGAFEAKRKAEGADVIITNAHVLTWDHLVQKMTGGQVRLLPQSGALFVDECHELEAVGRGCQSDQIRPGSRVYDYVHGLREWVDAVTFEMIEAKQTEGLLDRDPPAPLPVELAEGEVPSEPKPQWNIRDMAKVATAEMNDLLDKAELAGQDPLLAKEYRKEARALGRFVDFVADSDQHISTLEVQPLEPHEDPRTYLRRICVDSSWLFRDMLLAQPSALVSGTIPSTDPKRLGVGDFAKIEDVGHPFDYSKSTLAISPNSPRDFNAFYQRTTQVAQAINSTGGGALILFTSWKDLDEVMPLVVKQLRPEIAAEVYVQSKEDPASLKQDVEDFKAHGSAVLAGVRTLFTGLDIPGPALRNLIMWKLPYGVPTLESKAIERIFGRDVYWNSMLCVLTQGVGRLVRTTEDQGLVFIVDNRASQQRWRSNSMTKHIAEFTPHRPPRRG